MELPRAFHRGLIAAPFVVGAGALVFAAPGFVKNAVVERLARATGLTASVDDASIGLSSLTLRGVKLGEPSAQSGPQISIDSIDVDAGALSLWWSGASAVHSAVVSGVRVSLPLAHAGTRGLFQKLRDRRKVATTDSQEREPSASLPSITLSDAELIVSDEVGPLAHVTKAKAELASDGVALGAARAVFGGQSVELQDVQLRLRRGASGIAIAGGELGDALLRLPEPKAAPEDDAAVAKSVQSALLTRFVDALDLLKPGGARPVEVASAPATASDAGVINAPKVPVARTRKLADRLAPGAELKLARGRVLRSDGSTALSDLAVSARAEQGGALHLTGKGQAEQGSIGWNLRVWPDALRAEGTVDLKALPLSLLAPLLPQVPWYEPEGARVEASLRLAAESAQRIALAGEVEVTGAALYSPRLAPVPVRKIDLSLGGSGYFMPDQRVLEIEKGEVSLGSAHASVSGRLMWAPPEYSIDLDVEVPMTRCTEAVLSIPNDLLGDLALASWQGSIGGSLKVKVDSKDLAATALDIDIKDRCDFVTVPAMADLRRFEQPFVHQVMEPDGTLFEMETGPGTPAWTYLTDISPFFIHAVLAHEDIGFYGHKGFSPLHIERALGRNLEAGRYVVGASTITMQLVKNVFLHREKTLGRKIQEVLLTWWIERVMDKSDILELYLNVIEYGPGVYGIRNAARHWFGRLPAQLSPAEGAFLATILPAPKRYHAQYERGAPSDSTLERMRRLIVRLKERGMYGPESARYGLDELGRFGFARAGELPAPRDLPSDYAPLPHMAGDALFGAPSGMPANDGWDDVPVMEEP